MTNMHWPVKGSQDPYKKQHKADAVCFLLDSHSSCFFLLNSDGEQCVWRSYQLPLLPDGDVEESQYSHSFSLLNHKPQGASVSGEDSQQGALTKQDGDSMSHTLRPVLLQPRAQTILLQQTGTGELAGSVREQLRRAGEISLSQTGISSHLTEVWYTASPVLLSLGLHWMLQPQARDEKCLLDF